MPQLRDQWRRGRRGPHFEQRRKLLILSTWGFCVTTSATCRGYQVELARAASIIEGRLLLSTGPGESGLEPYFNTRLFLSRLQPLRANPLATASDSDSFFGQTQIFSLGRLAGAITGSIGRMANPAEEIGVAPGLQDRRICRLSGAWRRPDRSRSKSRKLAGHKLELFVVDFLKGQDASEGPDRQGDLHRHAQARRDRFMSIAR